MLRIMNDINNVCKYLAVTLTLFKHYCSETAEVGSFWTFQFSWSSHETAKVSSLVTVCLSPPKSGHERTKVSSFALLNQIVS